MLIDTPEGQMKLNWEPAKYKTKAAAAKALHKDLQRLCKLTGGNPDEEVWIKSPEESEQHGYVGKAWHVCWESGPYDWGICVFASGDWGHCETYWGFDLAFYE
jgi:hypothetical protein